MASTTGRPLVTRTAIWLFVVSAGVLTGASIFEHVVLTPLWAGSLPESVRQWPYGGIQGSFFMFASPLYGLFSLLLAGVSWLMPERQKRWALAAGISGIVVIMATIFFFLPILARTQSTGGAGLSDQQVTLLVHRFETWRARWAVMIAGWLAGLRALSLSWAPRQS